MSKTTAAKSELPATAITQRLLDAAEAIFLAEGYGAATMAAIARKARASTKTLYQCYASKDDVLVGVARRRIDWIAEANETPSPDIVDRAPRAYLVHLAGALNALSSIPETANLHRLLAAEAPQKPELGALLDELERQSGAIVRPILDRWRNKGWLPFITDTEQAAMLFVRLIDGAGVQQGLVKSPLSLLATAVFRESAVDMFLRGCGFPVDAA